MTHRRIIVGILVSNLKILECIWKLWPDQSRRTN